MAVAIPILVSAYVCAPPFRAGFVFGQVFVVDKDRNRVEQADALIGVWARTFSLVAWSSIVGHVVPGISYLRLSVFPRQYLVGH